MAQKAEKKKKEVQSLSSGLAESVISREFMAMTQSEMTELNRTIDQSIIHAEEELEKAPMLKNDHWKTDDVVKGVDEDAD